MASIYDIARMASADPIGKARGRAKEASARKSFQDHSSDIVGEINKAFKDSEEKAGKNKLATSIISGLIGTALSTLVPGSGVFAKEGTRRLVQALVVGATAGAAEKMRQRKHDATKGLKDVKSIYGKRREVQNLGNIISGIEKQQDKGAMTDALTSAAFAWALPTNPAKGISEAGGKTAYETATKTYGKTLANEWKNLINIGVKEDSLKGLIKDKFKLGNVAKTAQDVGAPSLGLGDKALGWLAGDSKLAGGARRLARYGGAPAIGELTKEELVLDPYKKAVSYNPYTTERFWRKG